MLISGSEYEMETSLHNSEEYNNDGHQREVDEGIGESETDIRPSSLSNSPSDENVPLCGAATDNDHLHRYISDTIHYQKTIENTKDGSLSTLSSTGTTTSSSSEKNSPDEQISHIVDSISQYGPGAPEPSGVMDSVSEVNEQKENTAATIREESDTVSDNRAPVNENWDDDDDDDAALEEKRRLQDEEYARYLTASVHVNDENKERGKYELICLYSKQALDV